MLSVFRRVFREMRYVVMAVLIAFLALSAAILFSNVQILVQVLSSPELAFSTKVTFFLGMYGLLVTNFTFLSAVTTVTLSVLLGINAAVLSFYIRSRTVKSTNHAGGIAGVAGIVAGIFGVGCAACGSLIVATLFFSIGAGGLLALLPLHGTEFGLLGIVLMSVSIWQVAKRVNDPLVCSIEDTETH